jgi:hypothetical protein
MRLTFKTLIPAISEEIVETQRYRRMSDHLSEGVTVRRWQRICHHRTLTYMQMVRIS